MTHSLPIQIRYRSSPPFTFGRSSPPETSLTSPSFRIWNTYNRLIYNNFSCCLSSPLLSSGYLHGDSSNLNTICGRSSPAQSTSLVYINCTFGFTVRCADSQSVGGYCCPVRKKLEDSVLSGCWGSGFHIVNPLLCPS